MFFVTKILSGYEVMTLNVDFYKKHIHKSLYKSVNHIKNNKTKENNELMNLQIKTISDLMHR